MPKCSLSTFAKSVDLFIETPFTVSSLIQGVLLLQDVKFICSLPLLTSLGSCFNSLQSCRFFACIAFNFMMPCSCIHFFNSEVIHGDLF